jgi:ribosomal protein S10
MQFKNKFQISINSSTYSNINYLNSYFLFILTQNKIFNLKLCHIYFPIKIKKFTLLKSPHIFKTARTQLEMQNLKKTIIITNFRKIKQLQAIKIIFHNLIKNLPITIKLQIKYSKLLYI